MRHEDKNICSVSGCWTYTGGVRKSDVAQCYELFRLKNLENQNKLLTLNAKQKKPKTKDSKVVTSRYFDIVVSLSRWQLRIESTNAQTNERTKAENKIMMKI